MSTQQLNEAAGALAGLPKHWINFLVAKWGKGYSSGDLAGEHSISTPLKYFDPGKIKKALKDKTNLAVIGKIDEQPIFMIAPHSYYNTKYYIFEVTKGEGSNDAKGVRSHSGRRGRSKTSDAYTMNEVVDIIDKMLENQDFSGLKLEAISKDPEREKLVKQRQEYKRGEDPLYTEKTKWNDPPPSIAQRKRSEAYASIKRPKLDARIDNEVNKMKSQISNVLDSALQEIIKKVKAGNTYDLDKQKLGQQIMAAVDVSGIQRLAAAYSAIDTRYSSDQPYKVAKKLKQTGMA